MDLDQLQSVRDRERQTDRLQQLRENFYEEAAEFVGELRAERDEAAAAAEDPFDAPRVTRLTDRIRTAEQTLEAIYEKRVGKVVKAATFAAADLPAEAEGMTREEADLFETLVDEIEDNRETVLGRLGDDSGADVFADEGATAADADASETPDAGGPGGTDEAKSLDAADAMSGGQAGRDCDPVPPEPAGRPPASTSDPDTGDSGGDGPSSDRSDADPASGTADGPAAEADGDSDDNLDGASDDNLDDDSEDSLDGDSVGNPDDGPDGDPDVERELVRITDDVGPILCVDEREYDLSADDVVTLPAENARPLVERGVAERLE